MISICNIEVSHKECSNKTSLLLHNSWNLHGSAKEKKKASDTDKLIMISQTEEVFTENNDLNFFAGLDESFWPFKDITWVFWEFIMVPSCTSPEHLNQLKLKNGCKIYQ